MSEGKDAVGRAGCPAAVKEQRVLASSPCEG